MAEHVWVIGKPMDKLDSGKDGVTFMWKKLEDGALLAANDHTAVHKCDRRRKIIAANRC
jgi:hypothetical protein